MIGLIVRLRFRMWWTAMSRSSIHLVSSVLGAVMGVIAILVFGLLLALLGTQPPRIAALTVPIFTAMTLMWVVLGLVASGVDNVLDPARFAVLPLRPEELARGLLAAACTGVPAIILFGFALGQVAAWAGSPGALPAAMVSAVLGPLTAILASRAVTSLLARVMTTQKGRMLGALVVSLATLLPLALNLAVATGRRVNDLFELNAAPMATAAAWFPTGWVWALPFDVAMGRWGTAAIHLLLSVALLLVLWRVWVAQLGKMLTSPMTTSGGQRIGSGRWLGALLGHSPVATVAARRIRAWYRDSRLAAIALRTAVLPVFFVLQASLTGSPGLAGAGVVTLAIFAGLTLMNDLAFDGEAWWMHVSTGLRGWEDRLGRAVASMVVFAPGVAATYAVSVWLDLIQKPVAWLSVVVASFLAALALALGIGAVLPGTAPRTGGNPFAATSGGAAQGCLTAMLSFVGPLVLITPIVIGSIVTAESTFWSWVVVAVAVVYGSVLLAGSVVLGGGRLDRRAPEMLGLLARSQF